MARRSGQRAWVDGRYKSAPRWNCTTNDRLQYNIYRYIETGLKTQQHAKCVCTKSKLYPALCGSLHLPPLGAPPTDHARMMNQKTIGGFSCPLSNIAGPCIKRKRFQYGLTSRAQVAAVSPASCPCLVARHEGLNSPESIAWKRRVGT